MMIKKIAMIKPINIRTKALKNILFFLILFSISSCYRAEEGFAESAHQTKIYYKTFGQGKPILIINGGPGMNSKGFETLAKKISDYGYQTIIYDQRGTGQSVLKIQDSSTVSMNLMIEDIEAIRRTLKIKQWVIFGHSFGGMLASLYATQHPQAISKLVLSSSGGIDLELLNYFQTSLHSKLTTQQVDSVHLYDRLISNGDTSYSVKLKRGLILARAYVINPQFYHTIGERLTQGHPKINQLIWQDMMRTGFDCSSGLSLFRKPVLIIQGKEDIIKKETAEKAHKVLKTSTVVWLEHTAHYGWLDNEKEFFKQLVTFINA